MNDVNAVRKHCERSHGDSECHRPIKEAFYRCKACEKVILCQRNEIEGHVVGAHNLALAEYSGKYHATSEKSGGRDFSKRKKLKGRTKTPGPKSKTMLVDSDDEDDDPEPVEEHNIEDVKKSTPGPKSKTQPGPKSKKLKQDQPLISPIKLIEEEKSQPEKLKKVVSSETDTSWRDACKFACNYCSEEMSSRQACKLKVCFG